VNQSEATLEKYSGSVGTFLQEDAFFELGSLLARLIQLLDTTDGLVKI